MPRYDYACKHCGEMEIEQKINEHTLSICPKCGSNLFKKLVSKNTSIIFKGNGFYETDYKIKKGDKE
jgi:putative FmdB family regulatory protein